MLSINNEPVLIMTNDWNISSTERVSKEALESLREMTEEELWMEYTDASFFEKAIVILELYAHYKLRTALFFASHVAFFDYRHYPEALANAYVQAAARLLADEPFNSN